jgi:hypothetical protein
MKHATLPVFVLLWISAALFAAMFSEKYSKNTTPPIGVISRSPAAAGRPFHSVPPRGVEPLFSG